MRKPLVAIVSFPGNNCEVESMRVIRDNGMDALYFRWNDERSKLRDVDGYFIPGGFAYEDRGRSGMIAGRDPLMDFIGSEAERGKAVIGNCNGAQILVESGLIPLGRGLRMSLARNVIETTQGLKAPGFLSEWVWIRRSCAKEQCVTSGWDGVMHLPIAHGEGRFTTRDKDLYEELRRQDQIAFQYCDAEGNISNDPSLTPNGSQFSIAGLCNPAGNVVALMPHPERTENGRPYFASMREWLLRPKKMHQTKTGADTAKTSAVLSSRAPRQIEIFIDTIIVNNEERTVEQTARRLASGLQLKQWKYFSVNAMQMKAILSDLSLFNPHKERAFIRRNDAIMRWQSVEKNEEAVPEDQRKHLFEGVLLLRRDLPDTSAASLGADAQTGICYGCRGIEEGQLTQPLLDIFANPHASTLQRML